MPAFRLPVRQLVEFLLRTGSIDSRFTGFDRANEGARIHRKLQKAAGEGYAAEVFLSGEREAAGIPFTIEGRADGIFTDEAGVTVIDEIKTTAVPADDIAEDMNPCHWAQGMVYGALYGRQQGLEKLDVRLTYYQIDTDDILRFVRHFTLEELEAFLQDLLEQYAPWAQRQLAWKEQRGISLSALDFPFPAYRPGQRALAGEVYRACTAAPSKSGVRLFCQAPTGIGKTMSVLFPALRAIGTGCGEKLFYLTARNTTQSAAEDAIARLRASDSKLALRSVTLTAKEKVCLHPDAEGHPACLPELCPYANGYYDRVNTALKALLDDGTGRFDRAALADAAKQFTVCPFELGLDLSEWCDVIIGDYNYLFDPVVHLRRFFDSAGDWLFLVDEAHNLPERARAMYSARFCKSSLTEAKRALGRGKSTLKTALSKADKAFLEGRKAVSTLAPRRGSTAAEEDDSGQTSLLGSAETPAIELPAADYAQDGTVFCKELPSALLAPLRALTAPLQDWLEDDPDAEAHAALLDLYFEVQDILRASERYDEHFAAQLTARGSDLELQLLCLDPSPFVDASLSAGRAAALFSATLTPPGYYRTVLGCPEARAVALESPFPAENLGLYCLPRPVPLRGRKPFGRAGGGAVQRDADTAGLLPHRPRLSRGPGRGAGKPLPCRKSRALLSALHLHPLPPAGRQHPAHLGRPRGAGVQPGGQLSGLLPQLCLSAAGVGGLHRPLPGHRHTGTGERSGRRRAGGVPRAVFALPGEDASRLRGHGRHLRRGRGPRGRSAHRLRHRGRGPAAGESPSGDAAPLLRRPERGGLRLRLPLARDEQSPAGRRAGHPDAGR